MMQRRQKAFTLIELLVVIAIIALLVSILLPSLRSARDLARTTVCKTNLRTMNMTANLYVSEFDGHLPALSCSDSPDNDNALKVKHRTCNSQLMAWSTGRPDEKPHPKPGWSICPSDRNKWHSINESGWDARLISYSHFSYPMYLAAGGDMDKAVPYDRIKPKSGPLRPSEAFMYAEADKDWGAWGLLWYKPGATVQSSPVGTKGPGHYLFRHQGDEGMNLVFYDGHVEYTTYQDWSYTCADWSYWQ
jgi:prepilin-type N-terminal cleavage/methylation domain-containing protein/prepilin-type processing-associated H-X9-DG protein